MTIKEWNLANGIRVSLEDYDLLGFSWHKSGRGYLAAWIKKPEYNPNPLQPVYMHHIIANRLWPDYRTSKLTIDHIDNNKTNNVRENLRLISNSHNNFNRPLAQYGGIEHLPCGCKRARIKVDGKQIRGKPYFDINKALKERLAMEMTYFGEHAPREIISANIN